MYSLGGRHGPQGLSAGLVGLMADALFYILAGLTLLGGFLVVANPLSRNPITSAMFLVLTLIALAGLLVLLHAFLLAAVQVLISAGAVMVLFLFVLMTFDLGAEQRRRLGRFGLVGGGLAAAALAALLTQTLWSTDLSRRVAPQLEGSPKALGEALFTRYLLPFEMVAVVLLVALIGVILLGKKELK